MEVGLGFVARQKRAATTACVALPDVTAVCARRVVVTMIGWMIRTHKMTVVPTGVAALVVWMSHWLPIERMRLTQNRTVRRKMLVV